MGREGKQSLNLEMWISLRSFNIGRSFGDFSNVSQRR